MAIILQPNRLPTPKFGDLQRLVEAAGGKIAIRATTCDSMPRRSPGYVATFGTGPGGSRMGAVGAVIVTLAGTAAATQFVKSTGEVLIAYIQAHRQEIIVQADGISVTLRGPDSFKAALTTLEAAEKAATSQKK